MSPIYIRLLKEAKLYQSQEKTEHVWFNNNVKVRIIDEGKIKLIKSLEDCDTLFKAAMKDVKGESSLLLIEDDVE